MRRAVSVPTPEPAADLGNRLGGTMRIGRAIIIPAILAFGVAGSTVAGSAIAVSSGQMHPHMSMVRLPTKGHMQPDLYMHS